MINGILCADASDLPEISEATGMMLKDPIPGLFCAVVLPLGFWLESICAPAVGTFFVAAKDH